MPERRQIHGNTGTDHPDHMCHAHYHGLDRRQVQLKHNQRIRSDPYISLETGVMVLFLCPGGRKTINA